MSLPKATSARELRHTRSFRVEIYRRDDGLWDFDAHLNDTKTHDVPLVNGVLPAHRPIHDMLLRLTVDAEANVVDVTAILDAVPFVGFCDTIGPAYQKMIGLNLLDNFRKGLRDRLSGVEGCTHLNELAMLLPDAAMQVLPFEKRRSADGGDGNRKPFELDNCHALRSDGPTVARYYPRWAVKPEK